MFHLVFQSSKPSKVNHFVEIKGWYFLTFPNNSLFTFLNADIWGVFNNFSFMNQNCITGLYDYIILIILFYSRDSQWNSLLYFFRYIFTNLFIFRSAKKYFVRWSIIFPVKKRYQKIVIHRKCLRSSRKIITNSISIFPKWKSTFRIYIDISIAYIHSRFKISQFSTLFHQMNQIFWRTHESVQLFHVVLEIQHNTAFIVFRPTNIVILKYNFKKKMIFQEDFHYWKFLPN